MYIPCSPQVGREAWVSNLRLWVRNVPAQTTFCPSFLLGSLVFFPSHSGRLRGLCHLGLPSIPSCIRRKNWSESRDGFFKCPTFGFHVMCCMLSVSFSVCRSSDQAKNARSVYMLRSSYAVSGFWGLTRVPSPKRKQAQLMVMLTAGSLVSR